MLLADLPEDELDAYMERNKLIAYTDRTVPVRKPSGVVIAGTNVIAQSSRMIIRGMKTKVLPHLQDAAADLAAILPR